MDMANSRRLRRRSSASCSFFVAGGIILNAGRSLVRWLQGEDIPEPGLIALWGAVLSILLKEAVFQYTLRQGRRLDSEVVRANAWHHRSDALSSIGALIGIGCAILFGDRWTVLDPLASLVVGFFIIRVAWKLLHQSVDELMEASLPPEVEQEILDIVGTFPDVSDPHNLKTRRIGSHYAMELHIRMDGNISLETSHARTHSIEKAIKDRFGPDTHVTVHVEPAKKSAKP